MAEGRHYRGKLEGAALALLEYIEESTDGFRILVRDSHAPSGTGTFASLISDIATHVEYILVASSRPSALTENSPPCTPRCWSAWSR